MTGAARLAARSAFAAGAGLVHVVVPDEAMSDIALAEPDVLVFGHRFAAPLSDNLRHLLEQADTVVIGPGLGREAGRAEFVIAVLDAAQRAVVDADALTVLAPHRDELARVATVKPLVLTPHRGEFRTLFAEFADGAATDPWAAADEAARATGATVLLKGVPTVIASGEAAPLTVASGNPGLASGGSGDVLSGLVGVFLAQGLPAQTAAAVAAEALGEGAAIAAQQHGPRTMRPMQVVAAMSEVWKVWTRSDEPVDREDYYFPVFYLAELLPPITG
jgi:NAD(P)H-hydrate epimerase